MNQHQRLNRAIALVRPVLSSVKERRPSGFSAPKADALAMRLAVACNNLESAAGLFEEAGSTSESKRAVAGLS